VYLLVGPYVREVQVVILAPQEHVGFLQVELHDLLDLEETSALLRADTVRFRRDDLFEELFGKRE
jgi:hypothetical protein